MKTRRQGRQKVKTLSVELLICSRTYELNATPYTVATGDTLYRVSYDNGPVHIFEWDEGLNRYAEKEATTGNSIPPAIEMAIATKLNEFALQLQDAA